MSSMMNATGLCPALGQRTGLGVRHVVQLPHRLEAPCSGGRGDRIVPAPTRRPWTATPRPGRRRRGWSRAHRQRCSVSRHVGPSLPGAERNGLSRNRHAMCGPACRSAQRRASPTAGKNPASRAFTPSSPTRPGPPGRPAGARRPPARPPRPPRSRAGPARCPGNRRLRGQEHVGQIEQHRVGGHRLRVADVQDRRQPAGLHLLHERVG